MQYEKKKGYRPSGGGSGGSEAEFQDFGESVSDIDSVLGNIDDALKDTSRFLKNIETLDKQKRENEEAQRREAEEKRKREKEIKLQKERERQRARERERARQEEARQLALERSRTSTKGRCGCF